MNRTPVPVYEKYTLTLEDAADYFNIGTKKIRELSDPENCKFVLWVGSKRLIKRAEFERYLQNQYSV